MSFRMNRSLSYKPTKVDYWNVIFPIVTNIEDRTKLLGAGVTFDLTFFDNSKLIDFDN